MCLYVVMKWWNEECKIGIGKCICGHGWSRRWVTVIGYMFMGQVEDRDPWRCKIGLGVLIDIG